MSCSIHQCLTQLINGLHNSLILSMSHATHQCLAQLTNILKAHQRLKTLTSLSWHLMKTLNILHNAPLSHWLTNVLQIQQDVIRQTSVVESCLSSFRDFPECCRQFGKPHGLPFLVELSCFLVHVRLPVRGTPCRPTSPWCSGTAREASWGRCSLFSQSSPLF